MRFIDGHTVGAMAENITKMLDGSATQAADEGDTPPRIIDDSTAPNTAPAESYNDTAPKAAEPETSSNATQPATSQAIRTFQPIHSSISQVALASQPAQPTTAPLASSPNQTQEYPLAIVIDDFGNREWMEGTDAMLSLPVKITAAVMPFMPTTKQDAEAAHAAGHDVIVHMSMEAHGSNPAFLGPGAITTRMTDAEIRQKVQAAIDDVPHAIGMNNHMGSRFTEDERAMRILMQVLKDNKMFFLDSRTTVKTVADQVATEVGVPLLQNGVFLDDVYTHAHVSGQFTKLRTKMSEQPYCIMIGHVGIPGPITSSLLKQQIPQLQQTEHGKFYTLTEMLMHQADLDLTSGVQKVTH
jgi:polysaccharide deacetylase 2 family uncharacterized protein YibQ